ncbi:neurofascin-like isoform X2 [Physella acuta]|uniref:neurofascin-like isoform X2 n=1 Tax=Physella acuta TaxID=109671 RepID=UPI0027DCF08D|nr:neurofascin-like isoform X2 [Physella acuta]
MSVTGLLWHLAVVCWTLQVGLGEVSHSPEEAPPYIERTNSQARVIIPKSQFNHFMLHCQAQGRPQPTYKWYTNGVEVDGKNPKSVILTNGTLVLKNLTHRYNMVHQCEARNMYGKSLSVKFQVIAEKDAETESEAPAIVYPVSDGQPLSIPCGETPPTVPDYIKKWYRRQSSSELFMDARIGSDLNGTLHFAYIEKADAGPNSNMFRCGLAPQSLESSSINMYGTYQIKIQDAPKGDFLPRVAYAPTNVKGQIGRSVTLECFFSGRPVPTLRWTDNKNNGILGNQRFQLQDFNRKLVITEVRQEDEGEFRCTGTNSMGSAQIEIYLNVTSAPMRESSFGPLTYPTEHDVTLNCTAKAAAKETLEKPVWYRNGEVFKEENFPDVYRYRFNEDRTRLSIKNLNKSVDTACYQCNISNSEGYIFYDGYIRVIDSIKIGSKIPEKINLLTSPEIIDLTVTATKDACCTLTRKWYINETLQADSKFENPPFYDYGSSTGTLFINKSLVSRDQLMEIVGYYRLSLYNRYQTVDVTFSLTLEDGPESLISAGGGFTEWWIILLCGLLVIIIAIVVVVVIIKSNYPRNTYLLEKKELKHNLNPEADLLNQSFQEI